MNTFSTCLKILTLVVFFFSCKRELSQEAQPIIPEDNTSQWAFTDSAKDRNGAVDTAYIASQGDIQALFLEGTTSDGTEQIFLQVIGQPLTGGTYSNDNVSFAYFINGEQVYFNDPSLGDFSISITKLDTARVEGVFSGLVVNPLTGLTSIRNGTFKSRLYSVPVGGTSEGTIECSSIVTGGQYEAGKETNATHYVEMTVNVTKPGTFQIASNLVNGILFAGEGEFPAAGTYTLQIGAAGTPSQTEISDFTLTYGIQTCSFQVNVGGVSDSLVDAPAGKLKAEEKVSGGAIREEFLYYSGNSMIGQINSTVNPQRRIQYTAQNKISGIEIWNPDGLGGYSLGSIAKFNYDGTGNVTSIVRTDENGTVTDTMKTFYYNSSNQVIQKVHFQGGVPVERTVYEYNAGNVTKISWTDASLNNFVGNYQFTYDTRTNKFKDLHPQFYYLSMTNIYNASRYSEALYFSSRYPVTFTREDGIQVPFEVVINPNLLPIEAKVNGATEYRWEF